MITEDYIVEKILRSTLVLGEKRGPYLFWSSRGIGTRGGEMIRGGKRSEKEEVKRRKKQKNV